MSKQIGIVVIGRNEGLRLSASLRAAVATGAPVVYADSGSTDESLQLARSEGVAVIAMTEPPFTAARGRNAGLRRLRELHGDTEFVQFVDGDTALDPGWLARAAAALESHGAVAAVCGHLVERNSEQSIYRRLMQIDWSGPVGEIAACGGNAMYRLSMLETAGGFRASLEAGEELDLCGRLIAAGGKVVRIDSPMGVHDSGIDTFAAWWTRSVRVGRAFTMLLDDPLSDHVPRAARAVRSALVWGAVLPCSFLLGLLGAAHFHLVILMPAAVTVLYATQLLHVGAAAMARGLALGDAALYSLACLVSKFAYTSAWLRYRVSSMGRSKAIPREASAETGGGHADHRRVTERVRTSGSDGEAN